jgi:hypothetical protein
MNLRSAVEYVTLLLERGKRSPTLLFEYAQMFNKGDCIAFGLKDGTVKNVKERVHIGRERDGKKI